jgi:hypothetical protein
MRKRPLIIGAFSLVALAAAWFLAVDWSWFVEECPDCGYGADVSEYRFLGIPLSETRRSCPTVIQRVSADLGVPCSHPGLRRWHKHRWWGLCICGAPCINGIYRIVGDDSWYDDAVRARVRAMSAESPSLGEEFWERVIRGHDWDYLLEFVGKLQEPEAGRPPSSP